MKKNKFKDLTDDYKKSLHDQYKNRESLGLTVEKLAVKIANELNLSERTIRKWFAKLGFNEKVEIVPEQYELAKQRKLNKTQDKFIITWAQNNTPVHTGLLNNIKAYADFLGADIHVIAGRYKNPTSVWSTNQEDNEFWDKSVLDYLDANRHNLHKYLSIMSDVKIQPTATNPMSGLQGMSGINSCIFGAPKTQLEMIPVLEGNKPKMMLTTGSITKMNYTDSKSGKKGEFHHIYGFVIVEIKDKETFYVRQVTADDKTGDFTDLYYSVKNNSVEKIQNIEAIVLGDLHYGHHDVDVLNVTHKFMNKVKPNHVVLHDVFDGDSISHHQMKDPFIQYGKEIQGTNDLKKELGVMMDELSAFEKYENVVIVRSNHDDFLDRWLKNEDWKRQPTPKNARLYMQLSDILLGQYAENPNKVKGVVPTLINERYPKFKTLGRNDSYKVKNWELGQHGDIGSNGSRGSLVNFRKLNTKIIVGHYHCLPGEYKVQTKDRGWVEIRSIKPSDIILSYEPKTGENVWNVVNEFIETDYNGIMLQIKGNGFEQTFTDKHMLMMKDGSYISATEAICTRSSSELPLTAKPVNDHGKNIPKEHIQQIVAIAADGSHDGYRIRFHLKKERKIKRLKELFGSHLKIYRDDTNHFDGYISTRGELYSKLLEYKYNLGSVKNISVDILDWDSQSLEVLIQELKYWDGTFDTGNNGNQFSTTNKVECNVISSALNRLGYSHSINKREYENDNHKTLNIITWCDDKNFVRNSKKMNHAVRFNGWGFDSYQANTKVYCVSVDNKCFWIQSTKTGNVSLTGNSPGRKDGSLSVGTSTKLRVGYNSGPSSWLQSHVIIHKDGKAQHINFIKDLDGQMNFTTFEF